MEAKAKRLEKPKYLAISAAALLVTAFALIQPAMQSAYAVTALTNNQVPAYDLCDEEDWPEDPISMNTVRSGSIVKTVHAEKEIFSCFLEQGNLPVIVDLTTYLEVYENIDTKKVIETNAVATICMKDDVTAQVIDCASYEVSTSPVFVGSNCGDETDITHPQEMNTVNKGKIAKTIEAQKEVFECELVIPGEGEDNDTEKKVDIVLFTEIYEDLETQTTEDVQFLSARCVVLRTDGFTEDGPNEEQDAFVESCTFTQIPN